MGKKLPINPANRILQQKQGAFICQQNHGSLLQQYGSDQHYKSIRSSLPPRTKKGI